MSNKWRTFLDSIQEETLSLLGGPVICPFLLSNECALFLIYRDPLPISILVMTSIANSLRHVYATFLCIRLDEWNKAVVSTFAKLVAVPHVAKEIQSLL